MQMVFVVILGHVVARAPPTARLISAMARVPRTGRGAMVYETLDAFSATSCPWEGAVAVEAPFILQTLNDLKVHLGWTVQAYNAAGALPNLIDPFWMAPLRGITGLKARDIVGFTLMQLAMFAPFVLVLLWLLGRTLSYHASMQPWGNRYADTGTAGQRRAARNHVCNLMERRWSCLAYRAKRRQGASDQEAHEAAVAAAWSVIGDNGDNGRSTFYVGATSWQKNAAHKR